MLDFASMKFDAIPVGARFVETPDRERMLLDQASALPGAEVRGSSFYWPGSDTSTLIRTRTLDKRERYEAAKGPKIKAPKRAATPLVADERRKTTLTPVEKRVARVLAGGVECIEQGEAWKRFEFAYGGKRHTVLTIVSEAGLTAVSCTCKAWQFFDEMCVHCAAITQWLEDTNLTNGYAQRGGNQMVQSGAGQLQHQPPQQILDMRAKNAAFYDVVRSSYAKNATDAELDFIAMYCQQTGLNLFAGQVNVVERKYQENGQWKRAINVWPSIHGQIALAEKTGDYEGVSDEEWCGPDGVWKDVWLSDEFPAAARCKVWRKGRPRPFSATVMWADYAQFKDGKLVAKWATSGAMMLLKCAWTSAFKKGFPQQSESLKWRNEAIIAEQNDDHAIEINGDEIDVADWNGGRVQPAESQESTPQDFIDAASDAPAYEEAEFVDAPAPTPAPPAVDPEQVKLDNARADVVAALKQHPDKERWLDEIVARGGSRRNLRGLTILQFNVLLEDIVAGKTPWIAPAPTPEPAPEASATVSTTAPADPPSPPSEAAPEAPTKLDLRLRLTAEKMRVFGRHSDSEDEYSAWCKAMFSKNDLASASAEMLQEAVDKLVAMDTFVDPFA